ncbi:MAG: alpha/beta hydrolase [Patescibacteria group bacterium]
MKKVFIVHGFGGIPNGGWISWLMKELAKEKIFACALPMPDSKKPVVSKWIEEIKHAVDNAPDDEIYLVGHSLGVSAVLKYFEQNNLDKKISGALLISGVIEPLDSEKKESVYRTIDSFFSPSINLENVKNKAEKFIVLHSVDDPAVPFYHAEKISKGLDCELAKVDEGGHFFILSEPIVYEFPKALELIKKILS